MDQPEVPLYIKQRIELARPSYNNAELIAANRVWKEVTARYPDKRNPNDLLLRRIDYLTYMAMDDATDPEVVYMMSEALREFPQAEFDITMNGIEPPGMDDAPLPMRFILFDIVLKHSKLEMVALQEGQNLQEMNSDLYAKGEAALAKLSQAAKKSNKTGQDVGDIMTIELYDQLKQSPWLGMQLGLATDVDRSASKMFVNTVVPNVLTAQLLRQIAINRMPTLAIEATD